MKGKWKKEHIFIAPGGFEESFPQKSAYLKPLPKEENLEGLSPQWPSSLQNNVSQSPMLLFMFNSNCIYNWHHLVRSTTQVCYVPAFSWRYWRSLQTSASVIRFPLSSLQHQESHFLYFFSLFLKVLCIFILMIMGLFALVLLHIVRATHSWYTHFPFSYLITESQEKNTFSFPFV